MKKIQTKFLSLLLALVTILSLVSHDFLHFLPHRSVAESPCNSGAFGLFCIFKKTSICKKKHIGEN